jgi:hypothetical protein
VQALAQRQAGRLRKHLVVAKDFGKTVERNPAGQVVDMVDADVSGDPSQDRRKVVVRTAGKGGIGYVPLVLAAPARVFELVLDVEEPHAGHRREKHRGKEHEGKHLPAAEPGEAGQDGRNRRVRRHGAEPVLPSRSHQSDGKPVLKEKAVEGHDTEQEQRMTDKPIEATSDAALRAILGDRHGRQVADPAPVEVARGRVVDRVGFAPHVIGCECDHPDPAPEPVAQAPAAEERSVAAIVLDHEKTHEEGGVSERKHHRQRDALGQHPPRDSPGRQERRERHGQFERRSAQGRAFDTARGRATADVHRVDFGEWNGGRS